MFTIGGLFVFVMNNTVLESLVDILFLPELHSVSCIVFACDDSYMLI